MLNVRVGVASSPAAGKAMAKYFLSEPLKIENHDLARYYAGETVPQPKDLYQELGQSVAVGNIDFDTANEVLLKSVRRIGLMTPPPTSSFLDDCALAVSTGAISYSDAVENVIEHSRHTKVGFKNLSDKEQEGKVGALLDERIKDYDTWLSEQTAVEARLESQLEAAVERAVSEITIAEEGGTLARLRGNLLPEIATKMGIDQNRPLLESEIANLLNGLRADGGAIESKQIQSPMRSLTEVFGLDGRKMPSASDVERVVAGLRVDGAEPREHGGNGAPLVGKVIQGACKRFLSIYGAKDDPTPDQIAMMQDGRKVDGGYVDQADYLRKVNATKAPVAYVELLWSPDKTLSVAWALANTEAERGILRDIHQQAVEKAMAFVEATMGFARRGKEGRDGTEKGSLCWISFDHFTARPTAEIAQVDAEGRSYTVLQDVPMNVPDMHLHSHVILTNAVFCPSGHVGGIDLDLLDGKIKEFGRVYQGFIGNGLREHGIDYFWNERKGSAQLREIPENVRRHYSKRSQDAQRSAQEYAEQHGLVWDDLSSDAKIKLLEKGRQDTKNRKYDREKSDFVSWREQAQQDLNYQHKTVLHTVPMREEYTPHERRRRGYERVMDIVADLFTRRSKINGQELREIAASGLIENGIGNPAEDIAAVTQGFRQRGVMNENGEMTAIAWGRDAPVRGKERWSVTTEYHEHTEREMLELARIALADHSRALPKAVLERHIEAFLARNSKIDRESTHWKAQVKGAYSIGTGGALDGFIGAPGAGKSTVLEPVVTAWKERNEPVYGIALANTHASGLRTAGIDPKNLSSIAAFKRRVERGRYKLDERSKVVIEEFGLIGKRDFLDILKLQKQFGFELKFVGDTKQCQAVEAAPVMNMLVKAFGENAFPEISTTVRQSVDREKDIAGLFRDGKAKEALAMKREDGTARFVAGGRDATIANIAKTWRQEMEENAHRPNFTMPITAPTNTDVLDIGAVARREYRAMGKLGEDCVMRRVSDDADGSPVEIALAVGEKVRLFDRIHLGGGNILANNADVVEIVRFTDAGFVARNADGVEGLVKWEKIRADIKAGQERPEASRGWHGGELSAAYDGPVRLTYGYARTITSAMSVTATRTIDAWPDGTGGGNANLACVSSSRHVEKSIMIINEAAERKAIFNKMPLGDFREIREDEIWTQIERNLSRSVEKGSALDFIDACKDLRRGSVINFQRAMEPLERANRSGQTLNMFGLSRERDALERAVGEREQERNQELAKDMERA